MYCHWLAFSQVQPPHCVVTHNSLIVYCHWLAFSQVQPTATNWYHYDTEPTMSWQLLDSQSHARQHFTIFMTNIISASDWHQRHSSDQLRQMLQSTVQLLTIFLTAGPAFWKTRLWSVDCIWECRVYRMYLHHTHRHNELLLQQRTAFDDALDTATSDLFSLWKLVPHLWFGCFVVLWYFE